jgi:hypothetical protein
LTQALIKYILYSTLRDWPLTKTGDSKMNTTFVRILSGNLGDGWKDQLDAAYGYAAWLEQNKGVDTDVVEASGVSGGYFDDDGNETMDGDIWWNEWCGSEDAIEYAE